MKKTVCLDLDGVLAAYNTIGGWHGPDTIGDPLPGAVEFTHKLAKYFDVLIYTTRCCEEFGRGRKKETLQKTVKDWLDKHGFAYAEVYIGQGKPYAVAYIDDRSVICRPEGDDGQYAYELALVRAMQLGGISEITDKLD